VFAVNQPDKVLQHDYISATYQPYEAADQNCFVYAKFLEAGYHQFLIYDPLLDKAFCKDLIVQPNQFMMFPELPKQMPALIPSKRLKSVWVKWQHDTAELKAQAFGYDIGPRKVGGVTVNYFDPAKFIKIPADVEACEQILKSHFKVLSVIFSEMITNSGKHPQVDVYEFEGMLLRRQKVLRKQRHPGRGNKISKAQIQLCFMQGTKNDRARGLNGGMCRAEFFDAILRVAHSWAIDREKASDPDFSRKQLMLSGHLPDFLEVFLVPQFNESRIVVERPLIQKNTNVNKILQLNQINLKKLYLRNMLGKMFTMDSALMMFGFEAQDDNLNRDLAPYNKAIGLAPGITDFAPLDVESVRECFVFAQETVVNEHAHSHQYERLKYIEFLEFICRMSLRFHESPQPRASPDEGTPEETKSDDEMEDDGDEAQSEENEDPTKSELQTKEDE
jgi:hypothetical protein